MSLYLDEADFHWPDVRHFHGYAGSADAAHYQVGYTKTVPYRVIVHLVESLDRGCHSLDRTSHSIRGKCFQALDPAEAREQGVPVRGGFKYEKIVRIGARLQEVSCGT